MILSSDELQILDYLKGYKGKFVTMMEICRRAGGRRKYEESAHWAKGLMTRLVEARIVEVNDRGHYRIKGDERPAPEMAKRKAAPARTSAVVDENYFSPPPPVADENYFPPAQPAPVIEGDYFPNAGES
ncbi:MAG: hypothetical protein JWR69_3000 [Pedosphaera sp.]|nr:hypothetical protein [Pedosphaera sp.]